MKLNWDDDIPNIPKSYGKIQKIHGNHSPPSSHEISVLAAPGNHQITRAGLRHPDTAAIATRFLGLKPDSFSQLGWKMMEDPETFCRKVDQNGGEEYRHFRKFPDQTLRPLHHPFNFGPRFPESEP